MHEKMLNMHQICKKICKKICKTICKKICKKYDKYDEVLIVHIFGKYALPTLLMT
jgi:hypothetical protein